MSFTFSKVLPASCAAGALMLAALSGPVLAQTAATKAASGDPVVARLGSVTINQKEVEQLFSAMPPAERAAVKANSAALGNWLRQRLATEALLAEARSKGWADRPEVKARVEIAQHEVTARVVNASYLDSIIVAPPGYPTDAEVKAAYEQGKAEFKIPVTYHLAQIFLAAPASEAAVVATQREEAKKLVAQARSSDDFAALARSRSQEKGSAERGGDVGRLTAEQIMPEIRTEVLKLKPGKVSDALQSSAGFHIVRLIEVLPARTATLEEVKPRLQALMRQQRQQKMAQEYAASLAPVSKLTIDNAVLESTLKKLN
ncbi:MAG: peptidylprolyl isomerase [Janthinobacterium lividum]